MSEKIVAITPTENVVFESIDDVATCYECKKSHIYRLIRLGQVYSDQRTFFDFLYDRNENDIIEQTSA